MKNLKYFFIFISFFIALAPSLGAMIQETKEVLTAKPSALNRKSINKRLEGINYQDCRFILQKTTFAREKNTKIKEIIIWLHGPSISTTKIGSITYIVPIKSKNEKGRPTKTITIGLIKILYDSCKRIGLATLLLLAALQDALETSSFCTSACVIALNEQSMGLFKDKLKFEKSKKVEIGEEFRTKKLPEILKTRGLILLEEAFKKLEDAAKSMQNQ